MALVTGASRGLGLAIAQALAAEGAKVVCMARPGAELDRAVATLRAGGADAISAPADVTQAAAVNGAVADVVKMWGRLDVLVLNAGTWQGAALADTTDEQWDLLVNLNLKGAFLPLRAAIPTMATAGSGTIVGIGSINSLVGSAGSAAYAASKWGLRGLLESAALELRPHGVRVSLVFPHNINSAGRAFAPDSVERRRNIEPADVAATVAFIAAAPAYMNIGSVNVWPAAAGIGLK